MLPESQAELDSLLRDFRHRTAVHAGEEYPYALYVPPNHDPGRPSPVILALHGAGECGRDGLLQMTAGIADALGLQPERWPFLVLLPQKPDMHVPWARLDGLLFSLLETVAAEFAVDSGRLYLTGISQGGYGTWALGACYPDRFAALVPVCGGGDPAAAPALVGLPIWAFHGEADRIVPVSESRRMVEAVRRAGGAAELTVYPGVGHNSWDKAYQEAGLAGWLLRHRRARARGNP